MTYSRSDIIGAACAVLSIGLIAYIATESWALSDCRETLRSADFAGIDTLDAVARADFEAFRARIAAGQTSEVEARCINKIGLPTG